jgi:hypothetical protein
MAQHAEFASIRGFPMKVRTMAVTIAAASMMVASVHRVHAQGPPASEPAFTAALWHSDKTVYVAGLNDVKPSSAGSLSLTQKEVVFENKKTEGVIPFDRISAVFIGDERVATGGTVGTVARLLPYGAGIAMGAVTNKTVDLLTIEYRDKNNGYHGAVFEVPKTQAAVAQQLLASRIVTPPVIESHPCSGVATPNAILVEPIAASDVELPAEDRVLLYEQLVDRLQASNGVGTVYRTGNAGIPCAARKLQLTVTAFKKGNEAVRATTGPVGFFVGVSSVTFHVSLRDDAGTVLFEKSLKTTKRGDGDSLNVTRNLAKSVSKNLAKAEKSESNTDS